MSAEMVTEAVSVDGAAGLLLGQAARLQALELENDQLRQALASRIVIEQAKGILAERFQLRLEEAFELLRGVARSNRLRIHGLALAVTTSPTTPVEIRKYVLRHSGARDESRILK